MCFRVLEDEIVAVCGPNGAGKSTLLLHLNGLLTPTEGRILIRGVPIAESRETALWRYVGLVFQRSEDQLFAPTVLDDVMFGPLNAGMPLEEARAAAFSALEAVGAEGLAARIPDYLSGGQKRLVAIAGVIALHPRVLVLDEPTADLDPVHAARIEALLLALKPRCPVSIVLATHDLAFAARIADRVCLVREGCVIGEGTPAEVFYDETLLSRAGLVAPDVVRVYREYCTIRGLPLKDRPLTLSALVGAIDQAGR